MKAITVTYRGPSNCRGSRLVASDGDGNRVSIPYPSELSGSAPYARAATALCNKMGWKGQLIGGWQKYNVEVFCFTHSDTFDIQQAEALL